MDLTSKALVEVNRTSPAAGFFLSGQTHAHDWFARTLISNIYTYVAPPTNSIQFIVSSKREVYYALVNSFATSVGGEIFLRNLDPSERPHGESDELVFL